MGGRRKCDHVKSVFTANSDIPLFKVLHLSSASIASLN